MIRSPLRVACLEIPAAFNQAPNQLALLECSLDARSECDLIVLPEGALTGYVSPQGQFDLRQFAEPLDGTSCQTLSKLAKKHATALVGPLIEQRGGSFFNTTVGFRPNGQPLFVYRKRHPWYPETWADAGTEPLPQFDFNGWTLSCAMCFDAHFLEAESALELDAAEVLLFPSAWVDDTDSRTPLLQQLSRRFSLAIVNCNWGIGSPQLPGQGDSIILNQEGARVDTRNGLWVTAQLERTSLERPDTRFE